MTFARVNTLGWALYEPLTSGQMNALDLDHVDAIDKVDGDEVHPTGDHIDISHTSGFGLRWMDPYWPLLEAREVLLWKPLSSIIQMTHYNASQAAYYYDVGADFYSGSNMAPARPNSLTQGFVNTSPGTSQVPKIRWDLGATPEGAMLKGVGVRIKQPSAGGSIEQPPKIYAWTQSCTSDEAEVALGNATASATYQQTNTNLEATFTPSNQDGKRIIAEFRGEAGANAQANLIIFGLFARMNVSQLRY